MKQHSTLRMAARIASSLLVALTVSACGAGEEPDAEQTQAASSACSGATWSVRPSAASDVADGNLRTGYAPTGSGWASVEIDLGCKRTITGVRRFMVSPTGASKRIGYGERYSYSADGSQWSSIATGNFPSGITWTSQPYGWAKWARSGVATARYVRFEWEMAGDELAEIEVDTRIVTSSAGSGASLWTVIDGDLATGLGSIASGWQSVRIEYPSAIRVSAIRRYMSGGSGNRGTRREEIRVSYDGRDWVTLTAPDTDGWASYATSFAGYWHTLPYGWTPWLRRRAPVRARFVEFRWEAAGDRLQEIEIVEVSPGQDPSYDFSLTDPSHQADTGVWPAGPFAPQGYTVLQPPRSAYELTPYVGMTGSYDGFVFNRVATTSPTGRIRAHLSLVDDGNEVRGTIRILDPGLTYLGGICGDTTLPVGTTLAVRMRSWPHDGRFNTHLSGLSSLSSHERFASGETSRRVEGLLVSGDVTTSFHTAMASVDLQIGGFTQPTHTLLFGEIDIKTPGPCSDASLEVVFDRRDVVLMHAFGW